MYIGVPTSIPVWVRTESAAALYKQLVPASRTWYDRASYGHTSLDVTPIYRWFRMPTEIWQANWLLTVDGGDGFHAVMLHSDTQAVEDKTWQGGNVQRPSATLAERRVKILETTYGVRGIAVDRRCVFFDRDDDRAVESHRLTLRNDRQVRGRGDRGG